MGTDGCRTTPGWRRLLLGLALFNGSRAALGACTVALSTWLLGPHERGFMVLGITMSGVAALFVGMGTGSALRSGLVGAGHATSRRLIASFSCWSVLAAPLTGGLAVGLSVLSAPLVDSGLAAPEFLVALWVVSAGQVVLTQLPDAWSGLGRLREGSAWATLVVVAGALGMLGGAAFSRTAWALLLAQGGAMLLAGSAQVVRMRAAGAFSLRLPTWRTLFELPRSGARALGLSFGLIIAMRVDRYMIGAVFGPSAVAVYSLAAALASLSALVPTAIGQIALREISAGQGLRWARQAIRSAVGAALLVSLPVAVAGWLFIVPFFGPAFGEARPLLLILLVAGVAYAPFDVASRGLLGVGLMGTAGLLGAAAAVAAVACYGLAVPAWGLPGAGLAGVTLCGGLSAAAWWRLRRRLSDGPEKSSAGDRTCAAHETTSGGAVPAGPARSGGPGEALASGRTGGGRGGVRAS